MSKRGQGEGSWRQLPSGSWEYRFSYKNEHGWSQRGSVTGATKDDARTRAAAVIRDAKNGRKRVAASKVPTLGSWIETWISTVLPHSGRAANTRNQYDGLLRVHVASKPISRVRITDLRPSALQEAVGASVKVDGTPLAHSSRRSLHAALKACLDTAVDDGLIADNPMLKVKRPRNPKPGRQAEIRALTYDHTDALLASAGSHRNAALIRVGLLTGMRRGELIALTWDAVGLDTGTLRVREQVTGDDADPADVKTSAGDRIIPIGDELRTVLVDHGLDQQIRHSRLTNPRSDLVFTDRFGQQLDPRSLSRWYAATADDAAVEETGLHALRHTAISRWIAAGIPITVVARWAGHADPSVTLRVYAWALPVNEDEYANRVTLAGGSSHHSSPTRSRNVTSTDVQNGVLREETA